MDLNLGHVTAPHMEQPQPLRLEMYKPPEKAFAMWFNNHSIRFLYMLAELCSDVKATTKRYTIIMQVISARSECEFNFDSPTVF